MAIDSSFHLILKLPLKLPTLALIDDEAAQEFINNIVLKLYLEIPFFHDDMVEPQLKIMI